MALADSEIDEPKGLCRDCDREIQPVSLNRCPHCAGPRIIRHRELFDLTIAHLDCDAFYAAVEKRDDPALREKPVIIGGGRRGVVSTACYTARLFGVRSAMPMFRALKLCPDAVVLKPNMSKYSAVGGQIRAHMRALTDLVQPISIDEAYMDLTEPAANSGTPAVILLNRLARTIEEDIGITVSIGLSHNKFMAKLASDMDKPRGFAVIGKHETIDILKPLPVRRIFGVGPALTARLGRDGIATVGQLQGKDMADLIRRYGKSTGAMLYHFSRGEDERRVKPRGRAKSISAETTLETDSGDFDTLDALLRRLCTRVADSLKTKQVAGSGVTLKLRRSDFSHRTRSTTLSSPTQSAAVLHRHGAELLRQELSGDSYRLIGIGAHRLSPVDDATQPEPLSGLGDQQDSED